MNTCRFLLVFVTLQVSTRVRALSENRNPRRRGFLRRITGDSTPYEFPVKSLEFRKEWPEKFPYKSSEFARIDPTNDSVFYSVPRPVYHIDEPAVAALTQFYRQTISKGSDILDICSSWVSHYPLEFPESMNSISATGMNALELGLNDQLTAGYKVADLNEDNATLPFSDASFDIITCVCSFDYLVQPIRILRECHRVLRPGGSVIISFSNRCFFQKATRIWRMHRSDVHLELLNGYFQYAGGFTTREAFDITARIPGGGRSDPLFVVQARKEM